jgi:hypothetical protein
MYGPLLNPLAAITVAVLGYIKHRPWRGFDYIWLLPLTSAIVSLSVKLMFSQTNASINELKKARYHLKGA